MHAANPLVQAILYLSAMVVSVPLFKKLGLGAVLGYLIVGALMGPHVAGLLGGAQGDVLHLAEFGVIMMLFLIGLELQPKLLWNMRGPIFGLGGMQVVLTTMLFAAGGVFFQIAWNESLAIGMILALSSTAIVLQTLQEKGLMKTSGGETSFAVLLFQDIAVIPILAFFPLLAAKQAGLANALPTDQVPGWVQFFRIITAVALVILVGRFFMRRIFRMVASSHLRELFTALALLLVIATTALMNLAGLSPALGAFLAGVVLADSEYRHQIEADIEPFKGILLAVFFISVGAGIDFSLFREKPFTIGLLLLAILAGKFALLFGIARVGRLKRQDSLLFAFSLAQGGEFAFVLLNYAQASGLVSGERNQTLTGAVALSMVCAPLMINTYVKWISPLFAKGETVAREPDVIDEKENPVIIAGFGRFGQMISRLLRASGIKSTVLDHDAEHVEILRKFGQKTFYGDASRADLLHAAGASQAKLLVIAIDDPDKTLEMIAEVKKEFPHLQILARAFDRPHAYKIINLGVQHVYIETAGSALNLARDALIALGMRANQAYRSARVFDKHNNQSIRELARHYDKADEETFVSLSKNWMNALEKVLQADSNELTKGNGDASWESPPRKEADNASTDVG